MISAALKQEVGAKAHDLIEVVLKAQHVEPPPEDARFNYLVDIYPKWHGDSLYFHATYACPGPTAMSPFFDIRFARLRSIGAARFALSFRRHTGRWVELYPNLSVDECLTAIKDEPYFYP